MKDRELRRALASTRIISDRGTYWDDAVSADFDVKTMFFNIQLLAVKINRLMDHLGVEEVCTPEQTVIRKKVKK